MMICRCVVAVALCGPVGSALGETVTIGADRDNTLFDTTLGPQPASSGAGPQLYAGATNFDGLRRALLRFDVAAAVPEGSTINRVTVTLFMNMTIMGPKEMALHRLTTDWGEAGSNSGDLGGQGAPAEIGDATWMHTFFDDQFWTAPGGDFDPDPSAGQTVDQVGSYAWNSEKLAEDAQGWIDGTGANHGWILIGDESFWSAKRFGSRENPDAAQRPQLTIDFTPGGEPDCPGDANGDLVVDMDDIVVVMMDWGNGRGSRGDVDGSGVVDIDDIVFVVLNYGLDCTPD